MILYPNAKINIGLNVLNKREDGFHNLESIFYPIPWYDILEINQSDEFEFKSFGLEIKGSLEDNLVIKAYQLIKNKFDIPNCKIHLQKQIPMGAGLGGGSADAAFTITALNKLFNLNIPINQMKKMADSLGSDCSFFIENKPKYVTGKGETLVDIDFNLNGYYIKLINPNIHISTKIAFESLVIEPHHQTSLNTLTPQQLFNDNSLAVNDFEKGIFNLHPSIKHIKKQLIKEGALYASMTGTGSTVYGIFKNKPKTTFSDYLEKILMLK